MSSTSSRDYPRATNGMVYGGILVYIAGIFLLISFASPYWIESYANTRSQFSNMGLWEYCFDRFYYPQHQYPQEFKGCKYVYSLEYNVIREWLLPAWLITVQIFVTLSFMASFFSQILIALTVIRYPLRFILTYEWLLSMIIFICSVSTSFFLFLAVIIFWTQSDRRDWLMYPLFNHISWSYYFCGISWILHTFASVILYKDCRKSWDTRDEKKALVMEMYPREEHHHHHHLHGFI